MRGRVSEVDAFSGAPGDRSRYRCNEAVLWAVQCNDRWTHRTAGTDARRGDQVESVLRVQQVDQRERKVVGISRDGPRGSLTRLFHGTDFDDVLAQLTQRQQPPGADHASGCFDDGGEYAVRTPLLAADRRERKRKI